MEGRNVLKLNEATIVAAVQEYLNRRSICTAMAEVMGITWNGNTGTFDTITEARKPKVKT